MNEKECCPRFNPEPWNDKHFEWQDKKFVKSHVRTIFFIPLNFGSVMKKLDNMIRKSNADFVDNLSLSDHTSKWNMDLYVAVDKDVEGLENISMSGKYYSKVYEGDFKETGNWGKDYEKNFDRKRSED